MNTFTLKGTFLDTRGGGRLTVAVGAVAVHT